VYIEPGSPWENPFVESFNSRARDELFSREIFHSVLEGRVMYFDWCDRYKHQASTQREGLSAASSLRGADRHRTADVGADALVIMRGYPSIGAIMTSSLKSNALRPPGRPRPSRRDP